MNTWPEVIGFVQKCLDLKDGWDGVKGSHAICPGIVDGSIKLANLLEKEGYSVPDDTFPTPAGSIIFRWNNDIIHYEMEIVAESRATWTVEDRLHRPDNGILYISESDVKLFDILSGVRHRQSMR